MMSTPPPHSSQAIDNQAYIPIFLSSDDNYARYIAVTITAILEQTSHPIVFHILDCGIMQYTKNILLEHSRTYSHARLVFHNIALEEINSLPLSFYYSPAIYARLYIAELVPDIDKAMYIDVDTCIIGDIATLFYHNLEHYGIGAVSDDSNNIYLPYSPFIQEHKKRIGLQAEEWYFNSGVLLINCEYWRKNEVLLHAMRYIVEDNGKRLIYFDQDALNLLFKTNYKELPLQYNFFSNIASDNAKAYITQHIHSCGSAIIHFTTERKPWNTPPEDIYLAELWWKYAKLTPFYIDFATELLAIRTKHILAVAKRIYTTSLYRRIRAYIKYKFTFGSKRKQYKEEYRLYTASMEDFIRRTVKH